MKILLVAPFERPESTAWLILKAIKNFGINVETFSYREVTKNTSVEEMNSNLKKKILSMSYDDLVFIIKGSECISPGTLWHTKPRKILWWFDFDAMSLPKGLISWASNFNTVFMTCYPWVEKLRDLGMNTFYMPQATDPAIYHPTAPEEQYRCDVAFIGSWKPGREEILNYLQSYFKVKVYGNGWKDTKEYCNPPVYLEEFNKVCSSAKVILNITNSRDWPIYERTCSQRVYMVMSAGGYMVTDYIPELPLKSLAYYDTIPGLKGIVEWAIANEELRINVCRNARKEILEKHTYYHRIKEILTCLRLSPYALKNTRE